MHYETVAVKKRVFFSRSELKRRHVLVFGSFMWGRHSLNCLTTVKKSRQQMKMLCKCPSIMHADADVKG